MSSQVNFPLFDAPVIDVKTGKASKDFYFFLHQLWVNQGGDQTLVSVDDLQVMDEVEAATGDTAGAVDAVAIDALNALGMIADEIPVMPLVDELLAQLAIDADPQPRAQPVAAITVGASPFAFAASFDGSVIVNPGTVSAIAFSRDGVTFFVTGATAGMFPVSRGDQIRVTYTVAPTMTFVPR